MYKIKDEEAGKRLKARLCPHGNHYNEKDLIRKDYSTAQFDEIRLLFSIGRTHGLALGGIDTKGAYLQSDLIKRDSCIRSPMKCGMRSEILWKLTKLPHGISEAGR